MLELISVHTPKCAGSSFRSVLEQVYSPAEIYWDYDDRPLDPASPMNLDPQGFLRNSRNNAAKLVGKRVVHGHFFIKKYDHLKSGCARITFLRHPISRLISHYYYWLSEPPRGHSLHQYVFDNKPSIEQFSRLPAMGHIYTRVFFRDVDMRTFDFIGVVERGEAELQRLGWLLGKKFLPVKARQNESPAYIQACKQIASDKSLMSTLQDILAEDIRFYNNHSQIK